MFFRRKEIFTFRTYRMEKLAAKHWFFLFMISIDFHDMIKLVKCKFHWVQSI